MTLMRRHVTALIGATLTSTAALSDAIMHGMTGRNLLPSDNSGHPGWLVAGDLLHGFTYAALGLVLVGERATLDHANRFVRVLRHVLLASLAVLAAGFVLVAPVLPIANLAPNGPLPAVWGGIAGAGFAGMILPSFLLGIAVLRRNPLGHGGRVLWLVIPVLAVTVLLGFATTNWAHPAYVETVIYFGVALIGVPARREAPANAASDSQQSGAHPNSLTRRRPTRWRETG